jgi:hypothetical protein
MKDIIKFWLPVPVTVIAIFVLLFLTFTVVGPVFKHYEHWFENTMHWEVK